MRGRRSNEGDTRVAPNGYHYTYTEGTWQLTHRVVMERKLGRKLADNERVVFKEGASRFADYNDPTKLEVRIKKEGSKAKRRAYLEARIEELQAELASLDHAES